MPPSDFSELIDLQPRKVRWDQIFLDPHNPRLTGLDHGEDPSRVPDSEIPGEALQADLLARLRSEIGIDDLIEKMKKLGFLSIDRIVVRPLEHVPDSFVVLEGNRRVASLRWIHASPAVVAVLGSEVRQTLDEFEVLVYEGGDDDIAWELQGLRHMGGVKSWGPYQQARFLVDLKERRQLPVTEVAQIAGLGRTTASRLIRSYYGFLQASKDDDFGDQVTEGDFSVFQEATFHRNNSAISSWLGWNDGSHEFENSEHLKTLLFLLKDTATATGDARITRVNPDLRDRFSKLLAEDAQDALRSFLDDDATLDQALQSLDSEDNAVAEMADLSFWRHQLGLMRDRIGNLPVPSVIEQERTEEFGELLRTVHSTITLQLQFLSVAEREDRD